MKEFDAVSEIGREPSVEEFRDRAAVAMGVPLSKVGRITVLRRSIDARSGKILYRYRVAAYLAGEEVPEEDTYMIPDDVSSSEPVLVAGAGPAGLFAALRLITLGFKPVIIERGKDVHARKYDIAAISRKGSLNTDSNYCFGEGGAGTFSDGKLYTRSTKRGNVRAVLRTLTDFGADPDINIDAHPHIGSDRLPVIMENIRNYILECGGEYHFGCRITDLEYSEGKWTVTTAPSCCMPASEDRFTASSLILATGHSASDIYRIFISRKWALEAKGFAMGVRAEHPQELINRIQYHGRYRPLMPPAIYSLVEQVNGRGVFSFCMCPGGILVPSMTAPGTVVMNGMSNSMRNSKWANAGIVTSVEPEDVMAYFKGKGSNLSLPEAMLEFREAVERRCFEATSSFAAPAQRMTDFVKSRKGASVVTSLPRTSYSPGACAADLNVVLPDFVAERLKNAFRLFDRKMRGYYTSEALLLAVESRTSSPVRIPRDPVSLEYVAAPGLYPCGEGAGYAGGIVSSAIDGINVAESISRVRSGIFKSNT